MNNNKQKYLAVATSFYNVHHWFHHHKILMEAFSKNFDKIFMINVQNLRFFPSLAKKIYMEKNQDDEIKDVTVPSNFVFFNPKNVKEFSNFLKDKEIILINNFSRHFFALKIYLLLKKFKIKQIQISNFGVFGAPGVIYSKKHILKNLIHFLNNTLFIKLTVILTNINIIPKLEIRFLSNLQYIQNIKKHWLKNFLCKHKFFWAKEIKLVNSRSYDILKTKNLTLSEDYIVHLDSALNYIHEVELRGKWPEEKIIQHYYYLNKFLKRLSKEYKKEVIITIHPAYDLEEHQKYFKDFKVLK
jgi:hypothetical protein